MVPDDKLKDLLLKVQEGTKAVFESENYTNFLKVMSKFHNYSARNCVLIATQCPDATYVAGYKSWQKNFNRQVRKDEKGIKIVGYSSKKIRVKQEKKDQKGNTIYDNKNRQTIETITKTIPSYVPVYVFDIKQTDGEPLPQLVTELDGDLDSYQVLMDAITEISPFPIEIKEISNGAKGYCDPINEKIAIKKGMSQTHTVKTAIHEVSHALLHSSLVELFSVERKDSASKEIEAESIAFIVCNYYGIDTSDYTFPYLASWSGSKELKQLQDSLETIHDQAKSFIEKIDTYIIENAHHNKIRVLVVEPKKEPYVKEIAKGYKALQEIIQGTFTVTELADGVDIISADEYPANPTINRIVKGFPFYETFVIVGVDKLGNTISLSEENINKYQEQFKAPIYEIPKVLEEKIIPIQGLDNLKAVEIEEKVMCFTKEKLQEHDITDVNIIKAKVYGSRSHGLARADSDLDVVIEYSGNIREDDFFNILHENSFYINQIAVDINPITAHKSGTIEEYMKKTNEYTSIPNYKNRLFVDMDGTLAVFTPVDQLETLYQKGYFENLKPIDNVVGAIKQIIKQHPEVEVNILSSYLSDSPYALNEKNEWLDRYLPEIKDKNRIFPPCGQDKKDYVAGGVRETDYLLDDYTQNLNQWEPPARGIKLLNGINHTRGTWDKDRLRFDNSSEQLASDIINVMAGVAQVKDDKPKLTDRKEQTQMPDFMDSTIVEVLQQKGNMMMLQWHYPNNNSELSIHYLDATLDGVRNGTYFDKDDLDKCQARFDEKTKNITETAEKDFSGFSYPYQKGFVLFNKPIIKQEVNQAPIEKQPVQEQPPKLERITSFVREILSGPSQTGENKYYGYCNGTRETDGFETIDELIKVNSWYTRADVAANAPIPDYNILSLYYSDGTVFRIKGEEYNVDFAKMPAKQLKDFVDTFQKEQPKSKYKYKSQTAPHQQPKKHYTDEQYEMAKNTNLVAFLQGRGYDLYPSGGWYRWREHPSLAVNEDGRWAWHSQNLKGDAIDFLIKVENYNFVDAVLELAGDTNSYVPNLEESRKEKAEEPKPPMKLPPANSDSKRAMAYLVKTRGLDAKIVQSLIKDKIIYETADYHNVVFVGYDKDGAPKYAAQRGTITNAEKPFKRDVLNSDKSYAFHLRGTSATKVAVFEAPIDAISHKCIQKIFKQDYNSINRIALGGVSDKALERYLQDNPLITDIAFCTDNDEPGEKAAEQLMQKYKDLGYNVSRIMPKGKDFNDDLRKIREEFAQQSAKAQAQPQNEQGAEPDMG